MFNLKGGQLSALLAKKWRDVLNRISKLITKHSDIIVYFIFGVLTTLVNFLVYFPLYNWLQFTATLSNILAWVAAVVFAFVTNKTFFFKINDWSSNTVIPELMKFVGCRIGSGLLETAAVWLLVDVLIWNGNWVKLVVSVLVVVINYISSKLLVFKNK